MLWARGDEAVQRVIEKAHERAIETALRWLEEEVAEVRWSSGRERAKLPGLIVATFRHSENRDGFPLLHGHCLVLNRAQRPDGAWYALDTRRLLRNVVAADTLYTLTPSAGSSTATTSWPRPAGTCWKPCGRAFAPDWIPASPRSRWIAGADGKPPRESSRYERAQGAGFALQNAIRAARHRHARGAGRSSGRARHRHAHRAARSRRARPGAVARGRPSLPGHRLHPGQQADAVQAHQQAAMPQEYLEGRTTGPAT
ncbi:relaxase domain-containing protein [Streptomyces sp. NPDC058664]|uniref:relaxase domain-containing protein n=1 Tax=unclassified Streptomyces TaxID=2593676 RepID=UPI00364B8A98